MADNGKYIKTKSIYTVRPRKHRTTTEYDIFERDYLTLSNMEWGSDRYSRSNFLMNESDIAGVTRKHRFGEWERDSEGNEFWVNDSIDNTISSTSEYTINLKPNKTSFKDFAYYGSATDLIKTSVLGIIRKFPAELYITDKPYENIAREGTPLHDVLAALEESYVVVDNPFDIDIIHETDFDTKEQFIDLRYMYKAFKKYEIISNGTGKPVTQWEVDILTEDTTFACLNNGEMYAIVTFNGGEIKFYVYKLYDRMVIFTEKENAKKSIRPTIKEIDKAYKMLDDFQQTLLDRETGPKYTALFDTIRDTERGYIIKQEYYTWPTAGGWNPDITSGEYSRYLNLLLDNAELYDRTISNNLMNNLVHDSIINMDNTTYRSADDTPEDYKIDNAKFQDVLRIFAHQFDFLKYHIDAIKNCNTLTYSSFNNQPDYFLTDSLNTKGWEVYDMTRGLEDNEIIGHLHAGYTHRYTPEDARLIFLKNLALNSQAILRHKGTRVGIEMLLALFGLKSSDYARALYKAMCNDYKVANKCAEDKGVSFVDWKDLSLTAKETYYDYRIDEYVCTARMEVADNLVDVEEEHPIETLNQKKLSFEIDSDGLETQLDVDRSLLRGLPVRMYYLQTEDGYKKYIVPWFDKTKVYDGNLYYQCNGGWWKLPEREINLEIAPDVKKIRGTHLFEETYKHLIVVQHISDLFDIRDEAFKGNEIVYVCDLSDHNLYMDEEPTSHYFYLVDKNFKGRFSEQGWKNIPKENIESGTDKGIDVLYVESIIDDNTGNSPHIGFNLYDAGAEYNEYFKQLFKGSIDADSETSSVFIDGAYDCETGEIDKEILNYGFTIDDYVIDNVRCWYFEDKENERLKRTDGTNTEHKIGVLANTFYDSNVLPFDFETGKRNIASESAANSIINNKRMSIRFATVYGDDDDYRTYVLRSVLPYLKQVIPSTSISRVTLGNIEEGRFIKLYVDGVMMDKPENEPNTSPLITKEKDKVLGIIEERKTT